MRSAYLLLLATTAGAAAETLTLHVSANPAIASDANEGTDASAPLASCAAAVKKLPSGAAYFSSFGRCLIAFSPKKTGAFWVNLAEKSGHSLRILM